MSVRDRIRRLVRPVTHVDSSDPRWYDQCYRQRPAAYMSPYRDSLYYFLWLELAPRLLTFDHVLEVGCGTGQFAHMLHDLGVQGYTGFDFSCEGVEIASRRLDADFLVADAMTTDLFETVPYDAVVMTEVLEHIPDDVDMLGRIRPGTHVFATLPDFDCLDHVRYFLTRRDVRRRYGRALCGLQVETFRRELDGAHFHLMQGVTQRSGSSVPSSLDA